MTQGKKKKRAANRSIMLAKKIIIKDGGTVSWVPRREAFLGLPLPPIRPLSALALPPPPASPECLRLPTLSAGTLPRVPGPQLRGLSSRHGLRPPGPILWEEPLGSPAPAALYFGRPWRPEA